MIGMPEVPVARLTLRVGRREFENLTDAWSAYRGATDPATGAVDPVLAMQRTGDVLRCLNRFLATAESESEK